MFKLNGLDRRGSFYGIIRLSDGFEVTYYHFHLFLNAPPEIINPEPATDSLISLETVEN